jgi:hypothetical protein
MLKQQGYRINIVQSQFINYCSIEGRVVADECHTYDFGNVTAIGGEKTTVAIRIGYLLASIQYKSDLYRLVSSRLNDSLSVSVGPVSSVAAMRALEFSGSLIKTAFRGNAYFIHLLLPHKPYSYAKDCTFKNISDAWPSPSQRYAAYLSQVQCVNKRIGGLIELIDSTVGAENAIVIIHGDHGSRLWRKEVQPMSWYGTLFAVRMPGLAGGINRQPAPIHELFSAAINGQIQQKQIGLGKHQLDNGAVLRPFSNGTYTDVW